MEFLRKSLVYVRLKKQGSLFFQETHISHQGTPYLPYLRYGFPEKIRYLVFFPEQFLCYTVGEEHLLVGEVEEFSSL